MYRMTGLLFDLKSSVAIISMSVSRSCQLVACIPDLTKTRTKLRQ